MSPVHRQAMPPTNSLYPTETPKSEGLMMYKMNRTIVIQRHGDTCEGSRGCSLTVEFLKRIHVAAWSSNHPLPAVAAEVSGLGH
jgi:hypothetical protein